MAERAPKNKLISGAMDVLHNLGKLGAAGSGVVQQLLVRDGVNHGARHGTAQRVAAEGAACKKHQSRVATCAGSRCLCIFLVCVCPRPSCRFLPG